MTRALNRSRFDQFMDRVAARVGNPPQPNCCNGYCDGSCSTIQVCKGGHCVCFGSCRPTSITAWDPFDNPGYEANPKCGSGITCGGDRSCCRCVTLNGEKYCDCVNPVHAQCGWGEKISFPSDSALLPVEARTPGTTSRQRRAQRQQAVLRRAGMGGSAPTSVAVSPGVNVRATNPVWPWVVAGGVLAGGAAAYYCVPRVVSRDHVKVQTIQGLETFQRVIRMTGCTSPMRYEVLIGSASWDLADDPDSATIKKSFRTLEEAQVWMPGAEEDSNDDAEGNPMFNPMFNPNGWPNGAPCDFGYQCASGNCVGNRCQGTMFTAPPGPGFGRVPVQPRQGASAPGRRTRRRAATKRSSPTSPGGTVTLEFTLNPNTAEKTTGLVGILSAARTPRSPEVRRKAKKYYRAKSARDPKLSTSGGVGGGSLTSGLRQANPVMEDLAGVGRGLLVGGAEWVQDVGSELGRAFNPCGYALNPVLTARAGSVRGCPEDCGYCRYCAPDGRCRPYPPGKCPKPDRSTPPGFPTPRGPGSLTPGPCVTICDNGECAPFPPGCKTIPWQHFPFTACWCPPDGGGGGGGAGSWIRHDPYRNNPVMEDIQALGQGVYSAGADALRDVRTGLTRAFNPCGPFGGCANNPQCPHARVSNPCGPFGGCANNPQCPHAPAYNPVMQDIAAAGQDVYAAGADVLRDVRSGIDRAFNPGVAFGCANNPGRAGSASRGYQGYVTINSTARRLRMSTRQGSPQARRLLNT